MPSCGGRCRGPNATRPWWRPSTRKRRPWPLRNPAVARHKQRLGATRAAVDRRPRKQGGRCRSWPRNACASIDAAPARHIGPGRCVPTRPQAHRLWPSTATALRRPVAAPAGRRPGVMAAWGDLWLGPRAQIRAGLGAVEIAPWGRLGDGHGRHVEAAGRWRRCRPRGVGTVADVAEVRAQRYGRAAG